MQANRRDFLRSGVVVLGGSVLTVGPARAGEASASEAGAGNLGALGSTIAELTDEDGGLARRVEFNLDPEGVRARLSPEAFREFLSFEKGAISIEVLDEVRRSGFAAEDVAAFSRWLERISRWSFDPSEETRHAIGILPPGGSVMYPWPQCQLYAIEVESSGEGRQLVRIFGQGLLKGAVVRFVDDATDAVVEEHRDVVPDAGSTFRYGRLSLAAQLGIGRHRAQVINVLDAGGQTQYVIDGPAGTFEVTA